VYLDVAGLSARCGGNGHRSPADGVHDHATWRSPAGCSRSLWLAQGSVVLGTGQHSGPGCGASRWRVVPAHARIVVGGTRLSWSRARGLAPMLTLLTCEPEILWERNRRVENKAENKNEFWADISVVAVSPVAIAAGITRGAYDAATDNGAFSEGFNTAAAPVFRAAREFGEEHGGLITRGVVTGAAGAVGARIVAAGLRHLRL
jgi:hypothetical protein